MSRAQTPNTPRAKNTTTTTNDIPSPGQAASGPLSPSAAPPDFPRRSSSSLHPSSLGPLKEKADDDMSIQHPDDGAANESQIGDGLSGQGQEENAGGKKNNTMEDAKERVEEFDWEGLEGRFWDRMDECRRVEEGLKEDFEEVLKVCSNASASFFLVGFGGGAVGVLIGGFGWGNWTDGCRSSMRGRLLVPWARRTELRSGVFLSLPLSLPPSLSPVSCRPCPPPSHLYWTSGLKKSYTDYEPE